MREWMVPEVNRCLSKVRVHYLHGPWWPRVPAKAQQEAPAAT